MIVFFIIIAFILIFYLLYKIWGLSLMIRNAASTQTTRSHRFNIMRLLFKTGIFKTDDFYYSLEHFDQFEQQEFLNYIHPNFKATFSIHPKEHLFAANNEFDQKKIIATGKILGWKSLEDIKWDGENAFTITISRSDLGEIKLFYGYLYKYCRDLPYSRDFSDLGSYEYSSDIPFDRKLKVAFKYPFKIKRKGCSEYCDWEFFLEDDGYRFQLDGDTPGRPGFGYENIVLSFPYKLIIDEIAKRMVKSWIYACDEETQKTYHKVFGGTPEFYYMAPLPDDFLNNPLLNKLKYYHNPEKKIGDGLGSIPASHIFETEYFYIHLRLEFKG